VAHFIFSLQYALDRAVVGREAAELDVMDMKSERKCALHCARQKLDAARRLERDIADESARRTSSGRPTDRLALDAWLDLKRPARKQAAAEALDAELASRFALVRVELREEECAVARARVKALERIRDQERAAHTARELRREDELADELAQQRSTRRAAE